MSAPPELPPVHSTRAVFVADNGWQPLPVRGAALAALGGALGLFFPCMGVAIVLAITTNLASPWLLAPLLALAGAALGAWLAVRRHRTVAWKLDAGGFAVRRGRLWRSETRVPASRVQHLDLKRGPLERALKLATLVIHTAGTKMAAVSVSGLDDNDAEYLRDQLAHQIDQDGDAL
jgi:membrane protein YdbS with pleckstrin-like domain